MENLFKTKIVRLAGMFAICGLFLLVLWALHHELRHVHIREVRMQFRSFPPLVVLKASVLTVVSYVVLTAYDHYGLAYAGQRLAYHRTFLASFISYVFSHNLGLSIFGGLAFRYRLYSSYQVSTIAIAKIALFCGITFWLGLFTLGGIVFTFWPPDPVAFLPLSQEMYRWFGVLFLLLVVGYVIACAFYKKSVKIWKWEVTLPSWRLAMTQIFISTVDWVAASSVLYVILQFIIPISFAHFLSVYFIAIIAGLISHIPGGLGVFESVFLIVFRGVGSASQILGALLIYRVIYYLFPLVVGAILIAGIELGRVRHRIRSFGSAAATWFPYVAPRIFAYLAFAAGVVLLVSGALPALPARRRVLADLVPLGVVEVSHLFGSVVGVALIIIARGLQRRLDGAYVLTMILLLAGSVFSVLKGLDYEEAILLAIAAALLYPCRDYFYRKASLVHQRFTIAWFTAIVLALMATVWVMLFAHRHVEYSRSLWWTFSFSGDAPRSLRATFVVAVMAIWAALWVLLQPPRVKEIPAEPVDLKKDVESIVKRCSKTYARLALLGDKQFLLNQEKNAFIMYGVEGRSWIALGDPVGARDDVVQLIWRFRELADLYNGWTVFYQVDAENLHFYVDAGLTLLKMGEEALVNLPRFDLNGRKQKSLRSSFNKMTKEGWAFKIIAPEEVASLLPMLKHISDEWLTSKTVREKRFSLGFFDEYYLQSGPLALVSHGDQIVAFANVLTTDDKNELSIDLMRHVKGAPRAIMDFLFISLMLWGKDQGYQEFNLGMAPFSGMDARTLAPIWTRLGGLLYKYGEYFYNFQGLREYKNKFNPEWRSKYLATTEGITLPLVLTNVASLISGGLKGVVSR